MSRVIICPITSEDRVRVGSFLHDNLNRRISASQWASSMSVQWLADAPNFGFMLLSGEDIVGVYLAFYSVRHIDGRPERFCNLSAWCVVPEHRIHSLLLLRALLAQGGYHFTDLSPSGNTVAINERLKFERLDTALALLPCIPRFAKSQRIQVSVDRSEIELLLTGVELDIYRDHMSATAARHLAITTPDEHCYVIFRRDRRKGMPLFASVLYVSNPELFRNSSKAFGSHLLTTHGVVAVLLEKRVVGGYPEGAFVMKRSRPKMFRSETLTADQIDYLYSELMCISW